MSPIDFDELHDRHDALMAQPLVDRDPGDEDATEIIREAREERIDRIIDGIRRGDWGPKLKALVRDEDAYEITDSKHPDHYETLVDIYDNRDKFGDAA